MGRPLSTNTKGTVMTDHPVPAFDRRGFLHVAGVTAMGAASLALLAACAPTAVPSPIATGLKGELELWGINYPPHVEEYKKFIAGFRKLNPGVTFKLSQFQDLAPKLQQSLASRTSPDLAASHTNQNLLFNQSGVYAQLEKHGFTRSELQKLYYPSVLDGFSVGDKTFGLPLGNNTPGIGMVVNLNLAKEAGVDIPAQFASWDDVWETARKLTVRDGSGNITRAGLNVRASHAIQYLVGFIYEQGGSYFDAKKGKFTFASAEGKKALQLLLDAFTVHKVDSTTLPDANSGIPDQSTAMGLTFVDYLPYLVGEFPKVDWGFAVRPPFKGDKLIVASEGAWGLAVLENSPKKDIAMAFLRYCSSESNLRSWYQSQNCPPASPSLAHDSYFKGDGKVLARTVQTLPDWRLLGKYPTTDVSAVINPVLDKVYAGSLGVEDALGQIDTQANAVYKRYLSQVEDF